jgi:hypothetical protein
MSNPFFLSLQKHNLKIMIMLCFDWRFWVEKAIMLPQSVSIPWSSKNKIKIKIQV